MTSSIGQRNEPEMGAGDPEVHATPPSAPACMLLRGVKLFTGASALAGIGFLTAAFIRNDWRLGAVGFTLIILASIGGAVIVTNSLLADRHEFYRRGYLDGWFRGWRGQEPEVSDSVLRA